MTATSPKRIRKLTAGDPETQSADIVAENIARLKALFPELVTEGEKGASVNVDVLKQLVGDQTVTDAEEKFGLNWHGKRRARQLALTPSRGTLRPYPEESVDWDTTQNLFIEGDNLEVLKLLQKSYAGKVKLIYIDPPYNTGNDFVYTDDFRDPLSYYKRITGQVTDEGENITSNVESSGRFHTTWLNMVYPRLRSCRNLLRDDGVLVISIDDTELAHLKTACDDIFGPECFGGCITRVTGTPTGGGNAALVNEIDYLLVYFRTPDVAIDGLEFSDKDAAIYDKEDERGKYLIRPLRRTGGEDRREDRPTMYYGVRAPDGSLVYPVAPAGYESRWICGEDRYKQLAAQGLIEWQQVKQNGELRWQVYQKFYLDGRQKQPSNLWSGIEGNKKATRDLKALFDGRKVFSFPKPVGLIQRVIQVAARDPQAIVLDFFAGSGTTAHALMQQNADDQGARRYIMVQLPEPLESSSRDQAEAAAFCDDHGLRRNIAELTKERLRRAGTKVKHENPMFAGDTGFRVFKLDSSNILEWQPNRDDLKESLAEHIEHLKADRSEQDILYELLLKRGLDLCVPIETKEIAGKQVHSIGAGSLFACLAESISRDEGEDLALGIVAWHKELDPAGDTAIVFRDDAFSDDVVKTNVAAILEQNDLKNVRSL